MAYQDPYLPPGVTQKMIDDHFGGDECPKCGEFECEHIAEAEAAAEDYYESLAEERRQERRHGGG